MKRNPKKSTTNPPWRKLTRRKILEQDPKETVDPIKSKVEKLLCTKVDMNLMNQGRPSRSIKTSQEPGKSTNHTPEVNAKQVTLQEPLKIDEVVKE